MKPVISFCIVLIFFQSLIFGSLVKLEIPELPASILQQSLFQKQALPDPFLIPENATVLHNLLSKNEWIPNYFNKKYIAKNDAAPAIVERIPFRLHTRTALPANPVFILNETLRL